MNCETIEELLPTYALSALPAAEAQEVRRHLSTCRRHDTELGEFLAVAEALPLAAPERDPPPAVRARLLERFDREVADRVPGTRPTPLRWRERIWAPRAVAGFAAAAAAIVLIAGLVAWNLVLQLGGEEAPTLEAFVGEAGAGRLVYLEEEGAAFVRLDLPEPPPGRTYQAWALQDERATGLGLLSSEGVGAFSADLTGVDAVAISEEPEGGSDQPTTDPLLVAVLD
ncbi:MAG: anti-sigma factor [Dehalococcoidia bacterium]|nr:anti-sigma factor [Dehalococcoidia bacterium]